MLILGQRREGWGLLVILVGLLGGCSCQPPHHGQTGRVRPAGDRSKGITKIVNELIAMPDWGRKHSWMGKEHQENAQKIEAALERIRKHDLETIRQAIVVYLKTDDAEASLPRRGKLYVLNKYLFAWPERYTGPDLGVSPGFAPDSLALSMWPLSYDKNGALRLTGSPMPYYAGGGYQAISAFGGAWARYGPRFPEHELRGELPEWFRLYREMVDRDREIAGLYKKEMVTKKTDSTVTTRRVSDAIVVFDGRIVGVRKSTDPGWEDFVGVMRYKVIRVISSPYKELPKPGTTLNVVVSKRDVSKKPFCVTQGNVTGFKIGQTHRVHATETLPVGWEGIEELYSDDWLAFVGALRIDTAE